MTLRQAAQQALEALHDPWSVGPEGVANAITALRVALAEPAPPPECKTEAEKTAFAHGWWKALEAQRAALAEPPCKTGASCTNKCQRCAEPEQEPVATKQMLRWVEHLKRLSDDGQHMSIPGLSSGACWELAIELEQFIRTTAPTPRNEPVIDKTMAKRIATQLGWEPPRKPLTDDEIDNICKSFRLGYTDTEFARAIERAHGIKEQEHE